MTRNLHRWRRWSTRAEAVEGHIGVVRETTEWLAEQLGRKAGS